MSHALIIIDTINEMLHPDGKLAAKGYTQFVAEHNSITHINTVLQNARSQGDLIIFVTLGFSSDYHDCPSQSPLFMNAPKFGALIEGTWATKIHEAIIQDLSDIHIIKKRVSIFYQTELSEILFEKKITSISFGGCATDLAVNHAVRDAHDRDYRVTVLSDCCIAANKEDHVNTLELLKKVANIQ